jgi:sugar lactone lactonase YvrE
MPTMIYVSGLALDAANDRLWVVNTGSVMKVRLSTGQIEGWIGKVGAAPSGGAAGCTTAAVGTFTPGWCTGGYANSGTGAGDGSIVGGIGIAVDVANDAIYVTDSNRVLKYALSTGAFVGWVGKIATSPTGGGAGCPGAAVGSYTPHWCTGGTAAYGSTGNGDFSAPTKPSLDSTGTYLYVPDNNVGMIRRFTASDGQQAGWMGRIATSPTGGDPGCAGAAVNTFTPGWCTGGSGSYTQAYDAFVWAAAIALDEANSRFYTYSNSTGEIQKAGFSGGFQGWMGLIASSPTGGDPGCSGAAVGTATPGWCTGGGAIPGLRLGQYGQSSRASIRLDAVNSKLYVVDAANHRVVRLNTDGTGVQAIGATVAGAGAWTTTAGVAPGAVDGTFTGIKGVVRDTAGNALYVSSNHRIQKFNLTTGATIGWVGRVAESPTGGAIGCAGAARNSVTPGWCTGGSSMSATSGDGSVYAPGSMAIDVPNDLLYLADGNRVVRYRASTGAFQGFIGRIGTSPTGGDPGCAGAASNSATPGWCTGGSSTSGTGDGSLNTASGVAIDSSRGYLYVTDRYNYRVMKFTLGGAFVGWIGRIGTSPTGGDPGCAGAAVGSVTPGWCTGGTGASGAGDGMFNYPAQVVLDADRNLLLVSNYYNHRIEKFDAETGAFIGWKGKIATSPTGGSAGCAGAAVGAIAPGWCRGGSASGSTSGDGAFNYPNGIAFDSSSGALYVNDLGGRVQILNSVTGEAIGWVGYVSGVNPTSGYAGCTTSVGGLTPGYCRGGSSGQNALGLMGYFMSPEQLDYDPTTGRLYLVDGTNNRVLRFDNL